MTGKTFDIYAAIKITVKLFMWAVLIGLWLCWALVALPVAVIADLTGHASTTRQWQRSLNWGHVFRL